MGLEDLRRPLREKMREMDSGLLALCISDRDGVPVLQCPLEGAKVEPLLRPYSLSMYANAMDHLEKMDMGKNEMLLLNFDHYQVVHFNHCPLVLTLIGSENVMAGQLIDLSKQLEPLIQESSTNRV